MRTVLAGLALALGLTARAAWGATDCLEFTEDFGHVGDFKRWRNELGVLGTFLVVDSSYDALRQVRSYTLEPIGHDLREFYEITPTGELFLGDDKTLFEPFDVSYRYTPAVIDLQVPLCPGNSFAIQGGEVIRLAGLIVAVGSYTGTRQAIDWETVEVPFGRFRALRVDKTSHEESGTTVIDSASTTWFALGLGAIKTTGADGARTELVDTNLEPVPEPAILWCQIAALGVVARCRAALKAGRAAWPAGGPRNRVGGASVSERLVAA